MTVYKKPLSTGERYVTVISHNFLKATIVIKLWDLTDILLGCASV